MTRYKGYYIDHVVFNSKAEIDAFIKEQAINGYKTACRLFYEKASMEAAAYMASREKQLHDVYGLTWEQIEDIENSVYAEYAA